MVAVFKITKKDSEYYKQICPALPVSYSGNSSGNYIYLILNNRSILRCDWNDCSFQYFTDGKNKYDHMMNIIKDSPKKKTNKTI